MGRNNLSGAWGEALAAEFLRKKRYTLVAAGYHCKFGEIDLVVKNRKYLVFVEVKYRKDTSCGYPQEAVNYNKKRKIYLVSSYYRLVKGYGPDMPIRYDVISILGNKIRWDRNAF